MLNYFVRPTKIAPKVYTLGYVMGTRVDHESVKYEDIEATSEWEARDRLHRKHLFAWVVSCKLKDEKKCVPLLSPVLLELPDALAAEK